MEDASSGDSVPSDESPAQKQARLRRERREAKIKAGGSARLDKITKLSGRSAEAGVHSSDRWPRYDPNQLVQSVRFH